MSEKYPVYMFEIDEIPTIYNKVFKEWCEQNCKETFDIWSHDWEEEGITLDMRVTFISEEDAMAFKLRWL